MAHGPAICACCGAGEGIEEHHLYLRVEGCPDDLTVWLCHACHGRAHAMRRRIDIRGATRAALAVVKERREAAGLPRLGGARAGAADRARQVVAKGSAAIQAKGLARARDLKPVLLEIFAAGVTSQNGIARELTARGIPPARDAAA